MRTRRTWGAAAAAAVWSGLAIAQVPNGGSDPTVAPAYAHDNVGITLGGALDIRASGTSEQSVGSDSLQLDTTFSTYGLTAGLVAIF
jgi:hypothetical protein